MYLNENTQSVIEFKLPKTKKWQEVFPTTFGADGRTCKEQSDGIVSVHFLTYHYSERHKARI